MTVKELKYKLENLPDDMPVFGYKGGNGDLWKTNAWIGNDDDKEVFIIETY